MANKLVNYSIDSRSIQNDDDDWETESDFVNNNNLDNSKKTTSQPQAQSSPVNYRASVIGRDFLQKQQPIDKVPMGPISKKPAAVGINKPSPTPVGKPASVPSNTFSKPASTPVNTGSTSSIKSVTSKFSQVSVSEPTPVSKPPVSKPAVSSYSKPTTAPAKPVVRQPEIVKATPPPVPAPKKTAPPPPKRIPDPEPEPVYEEPVYEEPQYEEPQYEEPQYEEPQYDQSYDDNQQYDQSYDENQQYDQSYDDNQQYDQSYDNNQQSSYPQAEAVYDYAGEQEGDLSFYKGDIIYVYDSSDESGWWQGEVNGQSGTFPSTFVKLL